MVIIVCKNCGERAPHGGKGMCFACYTRLKSRRLYENNPNYAKKSKEWSKENKEKRRKYANDYYKMNKEKVLQVSRDTYKTIKKKCGECGSKENLENHHITYTKNPKIEILCRKCHRRKHRK